MPQMVPNGSGKHNLFQISPLPHQALNRILVANPGYVLLYQWSLIKVGGNIMT